MLPSSTDPARSLTAYNSAAGVYGLGVGLIWWGIGMALAGGYTFYMYRSFRGKVAAGTDHHGY
jgi:cytochrome d ubiquinol oxidase subunit II